MRILIIFAFVGLTLGAVIPIRVQELKVHAASRPIFDLMALPSKGAFEMISSDWLSDLIEAILGIKVVQLFNLINNTVVGSEVLVVKAVSQLQKIILQVATEIKNELEAIINNALDEALKIMKPILNQMSTIIPVINRPEFKTDTKGIQPKDWISDIILALLGITMEQLLTDITNALGLLTDVINETLGKLRTVAQKVEPGIAVKINEVIDSTLADTQALVRPMLQMLGQIFPLQVRIITELIQALLSLDFKAVLAESQIVSPKIEQISNEALEEIEEVLVNTDPAIAEDVRGIIKKAFEEAKIIMEPILQILEAFFPYMKPKLFMEAMNHITKMSFEEVIALIFGVFTELDHLIKETVEQLLEIVTGPGAESAAKIEAIIASAFAEIDDTLKPLMKLLQPVFDVLNPLCPDPIKSLSLRCIIGYKGF